MVRWGLALLLSVAAFAFAWWVSAKLMGLNEGASIGVASAVLALVLAVAGWWAAREGPDRDGSVSVYQKVRAGRDAYTAGRNQVINQRKGQ
jgi:hypothetical protein